MATRRVEIGPTGETVRANVARVRKQRGLTLRDVSDRLTTAGRPMAHNTVSEIERGARRVDADDLMALGLALDVSPIALLMPGVDDQNEMVSATGMDTKVGAAKLWLGLRGEASLTSISDLAWIVNSQPQWQHARWVKDTGSDGND